VPLPQNIVDFFADPASSKTIATVDSEGNTYAAPIGSVRVTPDGSMVVFTQMGARETPKRLKYMREAGKQAVVVGQFKDLEKKRIEGYCIWCEVGDTMTSGPLFEKVTSQLREKLPEVVLEKFPPEAVWVLRPVKYKIQGLVPEC